MPVDPREHRIYRHGATDGAIAMRVTARALAEGLIREEQADSYFAAEMDNLEQLRIVRNDIGIVTLTERDFAPKPIPPSRHGLQLVTRSQA